MTTHETALDQIMAEAKGLHGRNISTDPAVLVFDFDHGDNEIDFEKYLKAHGVAYRDLGDGIAIKVADVDDLEEAARDESLHPFEKAGLGRAPFRFVAVDYRVGPIRMLDSEGRPTNTLVGSPGQPMGTCQFCYQGIAECCVIRDADGKTFIVGNVCVNKTGDRKVIDPMKRALRKARLDKKHKRDAARIERNVEAMTRDDVRAALAALPSPNTNRENETALDWAEWFLANAGTTGKIKACRVIEKATKAADAGTANLDAGRRAIADRDAARQRAAEAKARGEAKRAAEKQAAIESTAWLATALRSVRSTPFVDDMIADLEDGRTLDGFSPRCVAILRDIFGKTAGRGNSKAYRAKVAEFDEKAGQ